MSAFRPYLIIKNPVKVGTPTVIKIPKKVSKLDMKSIILKSPKFSKIIERAVLAELIYDYPVTVITIMAF